LHGGGSGFEPPWLHPHRPRHLDKRCTCWEARCSRKCVLGVRAATDSLIETEAVIGSCRVSVGTARGWGRTGVRRAVDAWAVGADEGRGLAAKRLGER
jgi:hypothetical protein